MANWLVLLSAETNRQEGKSGISPTLDQEGAVRLSWQGYCMQCQSGVGYLRMEKRSTNKTRSIAYASNIYPLLPENITRNMFVFNLDYILKKVLQAKANPRTRVWPAEICTDNSALNYRSGRKINVINHRDMWVSPRHQP